MGTFFHDGELGIYIFSGEFKNFWGQHFSAHTTGVNFSQKFGDAKIFPY